MSMLYIKGNGPIITEKETNSINIKLNETNVLNTGDINTFTNNINELEIDKYGRIHSVVTGSIDYIDDDLFIIKSDNGNLNIKGRNEYEFLGESGQISTKLSENNKIISSLIETAISSNQEFNTNELVEYDGNINKITVDKFGRIHSIDTGYTLPTPNNVNYLKIQGNTGDVGGKLNISDEEYSSTLKFEGFEDHITTEIDINDNKVIYKLNKTGINNKDIISYDINTQDVINNGLLIFNPQIQNFSNNITLYKGKEYILKQFDNTSINNNILSNHSINFSTIPNPTDLSTQYSNGIEFFIKDNNKNNLGPLNSNDYFNYFNNRSSESEPYIKINLPYDTPSILYIYSYYQPNNINNIIINVLDINDEFKTYDNVISLTTDAYGRLHSIKQTNNQSLMTDFDIKTDDNILSKIENNNILNLNGLSSHIKTYSKNNNIYMRLMDSNITSYFNNDFDTIIDFNIDLNINSNQLFLYDNNINNHLNILNVYKERTYKFIQKTPLNEQHAIGFSTNIDNSTSFEYLYGLEYHIIINNDDIIVNNDDYLTYFNNTNLNISSAYVLFTIPYNSPNILYIYSRFLPSNVLKIQLNIIEELKQFDKISSIKVDRFGRIHDIISSVNMSLHDFDWYEYITKTKKFWRFSTINSNIIGNIVSPITSINNFNIFTGSIKFNPYIDCINNDLISISINILNGFFNKPSYLEIVPDNQDYMLRIQFGDNNFNVFFEYGPKTFFTDTILTDISQYNVSNKNSDYQPPDSNHKAAAFSFNSNEQFKLFNIIFQYDSLSDSYILKFLDNLAKPILDLDIVDNYIINKRNIDIDSPGSILDTNNWSSHSFSIPGIFFRKMFLLNDITLKFYDNSYNTSIDNYSRSSSTINNLLISLHNTYNFL